VIMGPLNVNRGPCDVTMGPRNVIMRPWYVNRGPCNVIIGPRSVNR